MKDLFIKRIFSLTIEDLKPLKTIKIILCLLFLFPAVASAQTDLFFRVKIPDGKVSTSFSNGVIRGTRNRYFIKADKDQLLTVKITSLENNACFQINIPGSKKMLEGAGELDDATEWSGKLPKSGDYEIIVGGIRGNASYVLTVTLK